MTTHVIVKPRAYVGIVHGEIVRRVAFLQPDAVIVADFDLLNERDLVARFEAIGVKVSTSTNSEWR